jgi:hypothetical protein
MLDQSRFLLYLKVFALKMLAMPFPPLYAFRGARTRCPRFLPERELTSGALRFAWSLAVPR